VTTPRRPAALALVGPGLLVAATGVGAGDLATAGFAGSMLGVAVAWAIVLGAGAKLVLTEGIARWQLAIGETFLAGALSRFGRLAAAAFLAYFLAWTLFTGAALIKASGVAATSLLAGADPSPARLLVAGLAHSLLALAIVSIGSFKSFERVMAVLIGVMFLAVLAAAAPAAIELAPRLARGLVVPTIPELRSGGLEWTVALMGGVGGTVTILCYGPWIAEQGRDSPRHARDCRIDLATGYAATALFGVAMLVIAAGVAVEGSGVGLLVSLADALEDRLGRAGRVVFLVGAWTAIFSSMLGVWHAVPLLFREILRALGVASERRLALAVVAYRVALAIVPLLAVQSSFRAAQKTYAIVGAAFIPILALALIVRLVRDRRELGALRAGPLTLGALGLALALAVLAAGFNVAGRLGWL
jgi:Mn2+/Fe2+ NRAMP family transporter